MTDKRTSFIKPALSAALPLAIAMLAEKSIAEPEAAAFTDFCEKASAGAFAKERRAVVGKAPEWLFLARELEHLGHGAFWKPVPGSTLPDPAPEIIRYAKELKGKGIELLLVPVPPKAAIYPEKLTGVANQPVLRNAPFYKILKAGGVNVLDLEDSFETMAAKGDKVYCEQDSHWTSETCRKVASMIYGHYENEAWAKGKAAIVTGKAEKLTIKGDLVGKGTAMGKEELEIVRAGVKTGARLTPVEPDESSPILLMGDSHTLVFFEGGDMHCKGAGLFDHLSAKFKRPLDLIGSKASGGDQARVSLVRKSRLAPGYLAGKKLIIWCYSAREFTLGKWRPIPAG